VSLPAWYCLPPWYCLQYDEDDLPEYPASSSHLKGRDVWLVERVTREFATTYSQARRGVCGTGGLGAQYKK